MPVDELALVVESFVETPEGADMSSFLGVVVVYHDDHVDYDGDGAAESSSLRARTQ